MTGAQILALLALAALSAIFQRSMTILARGIDDAPEAADDAAAVRCAAVSRGRLAGSFMVAIALALALGHVA